MDPTGLAPSNDYLGPGVVGPQPKPQNQESGFVPLVQNPSGMPPNQTPNKTGYSNNVEVVPLYENLGDYNNAILKQGTNKNRSWFSINVEEPITKFIARNIFGLTPSDCVMLSDRTIVPMSESGTQFAYSERVVDCMSFCGSFLAGFGKGGKATRFIVKNGDEIAGAVKEGIKSTDNIPSNVTDALSYIKKGDCVPGANGGKTFKNRGGINPKTGNINQELPKVDSSGKAITYAEWDVNAKLPGASRDAERIVTGSDGSIWWTKDLYETFTRLE